MTRGRGTSRGRRWRRNKSVEYEAGAVSQALQIHFRALSKFIYWFLV